MLKPNLLAAYQDRRPALEALGRALLGWLETVLTVEGVRVHDVCYRVKRPESLAHKLSRPDRTYEQLEDITDLVGLRVITYFEDSIEQVARLVEANFRVDMDRSVDKRMLQEPSSFGYRSLHYVCRPPPALLAAHPEWDGPFEIQIRTILQHAWAEIEHDLGYKWPESVPQPVRRRFSRLAGLLELADGEFVELRRLMVDYAHDVRQPVALAQEGLGLDTYSLRSLVLSPAVSELDVVLARQLGRPLEDVHFFPDYVVRLLQSVQLGRPSRILQRLGAFAPHLPSFAERYFRFTSEAWNFVAADFPSLQRGYSLFLLAHWQALGEAELELHKVERMKAFYQRADYPDDEEEARRVARLFVRSFADWRGGR